MSKRKYLKKVEENLLNIVTELQVAREYVEALQRFGNHVFRDQYGSDYHGEVEKFEKGIDLIYRAISMRYNEKIADCFKFVGLSEKLEQFSREKLKEHFSTENGEVYSVMQFLNKYGNRPNSYYANEENEFRQEIVRTVNEYFEGSRK